MGAVSLLAVGVGIGMPSATASGSHTQIQGSGSTWAANAVNQWISDVNSQGLQVVFSGSGSGSGRNDFAQQVTDFAVTDIGFQGKDPGTGLQDTNCSTTGQQVCRPYAYEPIVAGGTAFPYHLTVAGKLVRGLRLSGKTLTEIFTYKIKNWDDPAITKDNNGHAFPSLPIIPVTHSEVSGSSAQFTMFMNTEYPSIWHTFQSGFVEYYPPPKGSEDGVAQNGSDGVMNFISSGAANGSIGYDEYSYALGQHWPVAAILNKAGYYTLPTQYNVAVALQHAVINTDKKSKNYLLQTLNNVYTAPEPQAYPLSSYSYFLIPTGKSPLESRMTTSKRQTLADFLFYAVCTGQKEIGPIGYSPLPSNLVQASFAQTVLLNKADPNVNVSLEKSTSLQSCDNPTFVAGHLNVNHLAQIAPLPASCLKAGNDPCSDSQTATASVAVNTGGGKHPGTGGGSTGPGSSQSTGANGQPLPPGTAPSTGPNSSGDPNGVQGGDGGSVETAAPNAASLAGYNPHSLTGVLAPIAVLEILAVMILPPGVYFFLLKRRRKSL